ncbi:hypothetical protein [Ruegeria meonggei]|uniref:hypothetical protein n=1 Tax=Ruegeria meonggei TaxID=1446476 RepID=UPI00367094F9
MTKLTPNLDTVEFEQLVSDGRGLIPAYAPEWTDHNLHDPGITLIDLIAYLVDAQIYRVGFVGDSLKRAFTRLLGVAPREAVPARMLIWPEEGNNQVLDLKPGTPIDSTDLIDANWTLDARIRTVKRAVSAIFTVTGDDAKPVGIGLVEGRDPLPIAAHIAGGPDSLEFELDNDISPLGGEGYVSLGLLFDDGRPGPVPAFDPAWEPVPVDQWDTGGFWRRVETYDLTYGMRQDGVILFRPREEGAARRFRIRLNAGFRPGPVTLTRMGLNVLPVTEGVSHDGGFLADPTGLPNQLVLFSASDLVESGHLSPPLDRDERPLTILVKAGNSQQQWKRVATFDESGPEDRHYLITEQGILFGNGLNGALPSKLAQILHGPLRRTCGAAGAVREGLHWRVAGTTYGSNLSASTPGRDRDGLPELLTRARGVATKRAAHLYADDIQAHLLGGDFGLARVDVLPRKRPGREKDAANGNRTVLIFPKRDPDLPPSPHDPDLLARIAGNLSDSLLVGERCHVSAPVYRWFRIEASLLVEADADLTMIEAQANALLSSRFWDVERPVEPRLPPSDPGRPVTIGAIETVLARIGPVISVLETRIGEADQKLGTEPMVLGDREFALFQSLSLHMNRIDERAGT